MGNREKRAPVNWARSWLALLTLAAGIVVAGGEDNAAAVVRTPTGSPVPSVGMRSITSLAASPDVTRFANLHAAQDPDLHVATDSLTTSSTTPLRLLGVDVTGTEDACIEDKGFGWGPFDAAEAQSISSWHANAVRVPLNEDCWLGINGAPAAYSGSAYQTAIQTWVTELNSAGLVAILDLHWSAPGAITATKQWPMPDETHSVTFWSQVASTFKGDSLVMFDLFNEPHLGGFAPDASDWACWRNGCTTTTLNCPSGSSSNCTDVTYRVAGMQQLVEVVRDAGADQPIMIGGLAWAATLCGSASLRSSTGTCAWLSYEPSDPLHQLVASFHSYYQKTKCNTLTCWDSVIAPLATQVPVVTGELGENDCSATFVQQYMQWADAHGVSYLLWTWEPAGSQSCGPLRLLKNWSGAVNTMNPVASLLFDHLGQLQPPKA